MLAGRVLLPRGALAARHEDHKGAGRRTLQDQCANRNTPLGGTEERLDSWLFGDKLDKKDVIFKKQTLEVIENAGSGLKNKPKQTRKRSR